MQDRCAGRTEDAQAPGTDPVPFDWNEATVERGLNFTLTTAIGLSSSSSFVIAVKPDSGDRSDTWFVRRSSLVRAVSPDTGDRSDI